MKRFITLSISALFAVGAWAEAPLSGEYVDLGLSVKWATCNLGATSSTDAGWYLAWGETAPKATYSWENYLSDLGGTMTSLEDAGTEKDPLKEYVYGGANYSEGIGGTAYDAATAALGAGYRMPTLEEFAELANTDNCEWVWYDKGNTEFNGVAGYKVTSKKTGYTDNSIFLPAAGCRSGENLYGEGSGGGYWSSTPNPDYALNAYDLLFSSDDVYPDGLDYRYGGFPVRPVYAPIAQITIGETTTKYYDVEEFIDAFYAIRDEATVKLLGDITLPARAKIESPNGYAEISLDLNGHNIKGNIDDGVINVSVSSLTIGGEGIVENIRAGGFAIGVSYNTFLVVNGGSYASVSEVCYVRDGCELTINAGKFKAPALYYKENGWIKPIVKGGLFSMNPSDCVAEGYEAVANDDEATKGDYPYKVVEKSLTPTAIEGVDAPAVQKAVKTIENGKVVIIRNGERYDIAGRKL